MTDGHPPLPRLAYPVDEVAASVGMNPDLLRDWIKQGKVPHLRSSQKGISMLQRHIDELIALLEQTPTAPVAVPGQTRRSAAAHRTPRAGARRAAG